VPAATPSASATCAVVRYRSGTYTTPPQPATPNRQTPTEPATTVEPVTEPTNTDILNAITALTSRVEQVNTDLTSRIDQASTNLTGTIDAVRDEMREGFAGLKAEIALVERYVLDARRAIVTHTGDPNAHRHDAA
jgi:hypothetical protein